MLSLANTYIQHLCREICPPLCMQDSHLSRLACFLQPDLPTLAHLPIVYLALDRTIVACLKNLEGSLSHDFVHLLRQVREIKCALRFIEGQIVEDIAQGPVRKRRLRRMALAAGEI